MLTDKEPDKTTAQPVERCPCGYRMPCVRTVPAAFCKGRVGVAPLVSAKKSG